MNWKNIKSLFVVEGQEGKKPKSEPKSEENRIKDDVATEGNTIVRVNETSASTINTSTLSSSKEPLQAQEGEVQEQFVEHLFKAIEKNDMEGVDYLEFKNTLKSFAKMPMDENLRYQSALTAVKTMGATEAKIFQSANYYLEILAKEEQSFQGAVNRGKEQKIDGELKRIEGLKQRRQDGLQMIEKLKAELESIDQEIQTVTDKVQKDQVAIDTKANHFYASYQFVVSQIQKDIDKLKQFSQEATDNTPE